MSKPKMSGDVLIVALNGIVVGKLVKSSNGAISFRYEPSWLNTQGSRAISLSLPLRSQTYRGDEVYHFFDNLLPDNPVVRERIQKRFQSATNQAFDLLSSIGMDCVGAIQLYPEGTELQPIKTVNLVQLNDKEIAFLLKGYKDSPLGMLKDVDDFRISLAGVQEKTALLYYNEQWCRPLGTTPTSHIFKLPIGHLANNNVDLSDSCENEWLCLKIAAAYGLPVADAQLKRFDDQKVIVVTRFDRRWSSDGRWLMRLPQEDFCQALNVPSAKKYEADGGPGVEQCMNLLLGSENSQDREVFFYSQIIFWLLAAVDGHAKNFSLSILPSTGYRMTPLYDIMSAYPMIANKQLQKQKIKMAMAVVSKNKHYKWNEIQPGHFIEMAKKVGFSTKLVEKMLQDIKNRTPDVIKTIKTQIPQGFPQAISVSILEGIQKQAAKL